MNQEPTLLAKTDDKEDEDIAPDDAHYEDYEQEKIDNITGGMGEDGDEG